MKKYRQTRSPQLPSARCMTETGDQVLHGLLSQTTHLYIHLNEATVDQLRKLCYSIWNYSLGDLIFDLFSSEVSWKH